MDKNLLMVIVLVVMIIFSLFQAIQLTSLKKQIVNGELSVGKAPSAAAGTSAATSASNLPGMVGGC